MRMIWGLLFALLVLVFLIAQLIRDPGYLLLSHGHVVIESSLWVGLVASWLLFVGVRLIWLVGSRVLFVRQNVQGWLMRRGSRLARKKTLRALQRLREGRWSMAERLSVDAARAGDEPLNNWLSAARAANELHEPARRDQYLREALIVGQESRSFRRRQLSDNALAIGLMQAYFQAEQEDWEKCHATLASLREDNPDHPPVLRLLVRVYQELGDWQRLADLLPRVRKLSVMTESEWLRLQQLAIQEQLRALSKGSESISARLEKLHAAWKKIPVVLQQEVPLLVVYVQALLALSADEVAYRVLLKMLNVFWDPRLVQLYGCVASHYPDEQLMQAEKWVQERPSDALLLLTLGRLCLRDGQWSKAEHYFETSLKIRLTPDAYAELGRLYAARGAIAASQQAFQQSVFLLSEAAVLDIPGKTFDKSSESWGMPLLSKVQFPKEGIKQAT